MHHIKSILIVTKPGKSAVAGLGLEMCAWLADHGVSARLLEGPGSVLPMSQLAVGTDLVIVLGGDGTMLGVARRLVGTGVPVLGVNMGKVGFLAEVAASDWKRALERMLAGEVRYVSRLALHFAVVRGGHEVFEGHAVNDLVVHRGALARVITLDVDVDGDRLAGLRADGLIISSPTGSTGYAVSARGPLVQPSLDAYTLTPICPFLGSFPPLVLGASSVCTVRVNEQATDVHMTVDGQEGFALRTDDRLVMHGVPGGLRFATLNGLDYFGRLRACGFVRDHWCALPDNGDEKGN